MATALRSTHRRDLRSLTSLAERDLAALWREFDTADAARQALMDVLPRLVAVYGSAAATLAADYFDEARDAAGARGRFRAIPTEPADAGSLDVLARVAVGPLFSPTPNFASALVLARGGLQRHIANADRLTVTTSATQDRYARGWQRVGDGSTCGFCSILLGRGAVYSESTASFEAHDHCGCTAEPVFG